MSKQLFRALLGYLALIALLSAIGAHNQAQHRQQWRLIEHKERLQLEVAALRAQAAAISGPLAVQRFAAEQGMIPAGEARHTRYVQALAAPEYPLEPPTMEIRTIWR